MSTTFLRGGGKDDDGNGVLPPADDPVASTSSESRLRLWSFEEVFSSKNDVGASSVVPKYVDAYAIEMGQELARLCGPLLKRLSRELPLKSGGGGDGNDSRDDGGAATTGSDRADGNATDAAWIDLSHLKRVKRTRIEAAATATTTRSGTTTGAAADGDDGGGKVSSKTTSTAAAATLGGGDHEDDASASATTTGNNGGRKRQRREDDSADAAAASSSSGTKASTANATAAAANSANSNSSCNMRLEVLLGEVGAVRRKYCQTPLPAATAESASDRLVEALRLPAGANVRVVKVPRRPPESQREWREFHSAWPTSYFPQRTLEYRMHELRLSEREIRQMRLGVRAALADAADAAEAATETEAVSQQHPEPSSSAAGVEGTVILAPDTGQVVSRSNEERVLQQQLQHPSDAWNPLETSVILAIQGVSRREREVALRQGMQSAEFQAGQYLCTGYDVYTTREPSVYEAMALVHARIRRLVFVKSGADDGCGDGAASAAPLEKGITGWSVHSLPGTNHKYRAFVASPMSPS